MSQQPKNKVKFTIGVDMAPIRSSDRTLLTLMKVENGITWICENAFQPKDLTIPGQDAWREAKIKQWEKQYNLLNTQIIVF